MRVALLLSGQLRGFGKAFPTWDWLLDQVTDVYYFCTLPKAQQTQVRDMIPDALGGYCIEEQEPKGPWTPIPDEQAATNMHKQFWKLRECWRIMQRSDYDLVIRCRPDLAFNDKVEFRDLDPATLWVPKRYSWGGLCDQFAVGGTDVMVRYCEFYDHMDDWVDSPSFVRDHYWRGNPETRLAKHMEGHKVERFDLNFCRVKEDGSLDGIEPQHLGEWF